MASAVGMVERFFGPQIGADVFNCLQSCGLRVFPSPEYAIFPGFCDVHVHFREPGFSYKETIRTGSLAAARGGYTAVCTMPNLNPVPDSVENLHRQTEIIRRDAVVHVYPYGAITVGQQGRELAELAGMAPEVIAFSDDGRGVQSDELMEQAMIKAKALGKIIVAHCEVNSLLRGGYIHDGAYAKAHGHRGICSESEYAQIARDLELVKKTGCAYHVCHVSAKESVALIRQAKAEGLDVTCETGPHYLVMDEGFLREDGRFKMNPPLRGPEDRAALIDGLRDGTIEGLETAFPILYTYMVRQNILSLEKLIELLSLAPRKRFGIPMGTDFSVWKLDTKYTIDPERFASMGRATPFTGMVVLGENVMTIAGGKAVWKKE